MLLGRGGSYQIRISSYFFLSGLKKKFNLIDVIRELLFFDLCIGFFFFITVSVNLDGFFSYNSVKKKKNRRGLNLLPSDCSVSTFNGDDSGF